ncbi:Spindle pole body component [Metarhizium anisopliae BRIP 53293]|uniref:Spindle pole body component n=1 Tax=Metarhizium anisopliae BRIP 53293 TaxID=1291518 RepID=A0A0D9P5Z0_METAN|nr:Spindle pole body component [Metarhizium anisopliae BRIP 53293]
MASGTARAASRANSYADDRMRSSMPNGSFRSERPDPRAPEASHPEAQYPGMAHKRTASGNPRPVNRSISTQERRYEERRVTERTFEAHVDRILKRNPSPEKQHRRSATGERREGEVRKQKSTEFRPRGSQSDASQAPWDPEATLLPHTSAPLASRISIPPAASTVPQAPQPKSLNELTLEIQEAAIVEDLLFVFMGYEGQYIRFAKGYDPTEERDRLTGPGFKISPGLDPSLADLTRTMLKMATYYSALEAFVDVQSRVEFGAVNHALCASIRKFLQDYLIMIAQLETQFLTSESFTVHVLNIHTMPTCQMMHQLYLLAHELLKKNGIVDDETEDEDDEIENDDAMIERLREGGELIPGNMTSKKICKGGVVLGLITMRLERMSGDPAARALLTSLLRDASRPYMVMLNEWLHHGSIYDPHSEFVIEERKSINRERFKVVTDVPTTFDDPRFLENVNNAYAHANKSLMQLLLTTHALPARLQSLKHYFFLDPSDYFSYFLELGSSELRKPVKNVNTSKLQSLLDLVLRQPGSIVSLDPFKEDVKVEMNDVTLIKSLQRVVNIRGIEQGEPLQPVANQHIEKDKNATGFTSLQIDYSVPFPVSLVISRRTIWRYQSLFRYLLSLRYLESQLSTTWQTQTRGVSWAHKGQNRALELWKRRAWTLRARMLVFVQQLLYFCTAEVIEPNWTKFMSRLSAKDGDPTKPSAPTRTVDELMQDHVDFLDTCLKECMLTNSKLLRVVNPLSPCLPLSLLSSHYFSLTSVQIHSKLMQTCTIFAAYTKWLTQELEKSDPDLSCTTKPKTMTVDQWNRFQATKAASRPQPDSSSAPTDPESRVNNLSEIIKKWENNFSRHLQILLDALNFYAATETVVLLSLCARLSTANQGTEFAGRGQDEDIG